MVQFSKYIFLIINSYLKYSSFLKLFYADTNVMLFIFIIVLISNLHYSPLIT